MHLSPLTAGITEPYVRPSCRAAALVTVLLAAIIEVTGIARIVQKMFTQPRARFGGLWTVICPVILLEFLLPVGLLLPFTVQSFVNSW
jgi:uncharacterized membrane protein HdeD (DUF308 family)